MMKFILGVFLSSIFMLNGCTTTQSIDTGRNLSSSGVAYADAVDALLNVAVDKVIDASSEELKLVRVGSNPEEMLEKNNEETSKLVVEIESFRKSSKILKAYFLSLQALVDSPIKNDAGESVKELSAVIGSLNRNDKNPLTKDQIDQIGLLGGIAANTVHAEKIKRVLMRDAGVIGACLALHERQLENISDTLKNGFELANLSFYNDKVYDPYVSNMPLDNSWNDDRKKWFKAGFISEQLDTAKKGAKNLRAIWEDILKGESDSGSIRVMLSDVSEFVEAARALSNSTGFE